MSKKNTFSLLLIMVKVVCFIGQHRNTSTHIQTHTHRPETE